MDELTLKEREIFANDLYATRTSGIIIDKAEIGHSLCSMQITEGHLNAAGYVMGGAIFTLADFAFGVAANTEKPVTVTLSSNIQFISAAKCSKLFADAKCVKEGRSIVFYDVNITDDSGKTIATASCSGFRSEKLRINTND